MYAPPLLAVKSLLLPSILFLLLIIQFAVHNAMAATNSTVSNAQNTDIQSESDSGIVSFDQKTYMVGDTATVTVNDSSLNAGNDLVVVYSSVPPVDTLSNPQDPVTDTVGQAGLGTYSDGTPIGMLFDIQWGQQDRRWSNSDVPTNKITASCWGGNNSNTGTPGGFATGLAASGFFLARLPQARVFSKARLRFQIAFVWLR